MRTRVCSSPSLSEARARRLRHNSAHRRLAAIAAAKALRLTEKFATCTARMPRLASTRVTMRPLSPRAWWASVLAVLWIATLLLRLVCAGEFVGAVHCCCGAHPGDAPCGCVDCPLADHDEGAGLHPWDADTDADPPNGDHVGNRAAAFKRCGAEGKFVALDCVVATVVDVARMVPTAVPPRQQTAYRVTAPEPLWLTIVPPPIVAAQVG